MAALTPQPNHRTPNPRLQYTGSSSWCCSSCTAYCRPLHSFFPPPTHPHPQFPRGHAYPHPPPLQALEHPPPPPTLHGLQLEACHALTDASAAPLRAALAAATRLTTLLLLDVPAATNTWLAELGAPAGGAAAAAAGPGGGGGSVPGGKSPVTRGGGGGSPRSTRWSSGGRGAGGGEAGAAEAAGGAAGVGGGGSSGGGGGVLSSLEALVLGKLPGLTDAGLEVG